MCGMSVLAFFMSDLHFAVFPISTRTGRYGRNEKNPGSLYAVTG